MQNDNSWWENAGRGLDGDGTPDTDKEAQKETADTDPGTAPDGARDYREDADFHQYGSMPDPEERQNERRYDPSLSKPKTAAYSIVSLVLGIVGCLCCCSAYLSLIMGVGAVVFAIVARRHLGYFDGMAIGGLVTGIIGFVFGIAGVLMTVFFFGNEDFWQMVEEALERAEEDPEGTMFVLLKRF